MSLADKLLKIAARETWNIRKGFIPEPNPAFLRRNTCSEVVVLGKTKGNLTKTCRAPFTKGKLEMVTLFAQRSVPRRIPQEFESVFEDVAHNVFSLEIHTAEGHIPIGHYNGRQQIRAPTPL